MSTNIVFAIEVHHERKSAAIASAFLRPDNLTEINVVDFRPDTGWVTSRVQDIHERWNPVTWVIDKRAATGTELFELERAEIPVETLQATDVVTACGQLYDAFRDGTIRHRGQPCLEKALAAANWRKLGESRAFDRLNSPVDQSPLMAVTFAHWGFLKFGTRELLCLSALVRTTACLLITMKSRLSGFFISRWACLSVKSLASSAGRRTRLNGYLILPRVSATGVIAPSPTLLKSKSTYLPVI